MLNIAYYQSASVRKIFIVAVPIRYWSDVNMNAKENDRMIAEKSRNLVADLESGNYDHSQIDDAKKARLLRTAKRVLREVA